MKKNLNRYIISIFFICLFFIFVNKTFSQSDTSNADININWQTIDSYTPSLYEGRALPGEESYIKAVAEVKISTPAGDLDSSKLFYSWTYNGKIVYNYSVTNGKIIYFTLDSLKNTDTLDLKIYSDNSQDNLLGEKSITITPYSSVIPLYKQNDNPILTYSNVINKRYETYNVNTGDLFNILAEPFYFSISNPTDLDLSYEWKLDNILATNSFTNIFNYSSPNTIGQNSGISLKITNQNSNKNLQEGNTLVNFNVIQLKSK
ncbi:MAG: hypothetical protein WCO35_03640 [Candidatus Nomurabacteria bacterium]